MELYYQYTDENRDCVINPVRSIFSKSTRSHDKRSHILEIKPESTLCNSLEQH